MREERDYLQDRIAHDVEHEPGFAEAWAPYALMGRLVGERNRLGLTQRDLAARIGVAHSAVARMENHPGGVSLARLLAYAQTVEVEFVMRPNTELPQAKSKDGSFAGM